MNIGKFDNHIRTIQGDISNIYNAFYVWRTLQKSEYNEIYKKNKYFWGITIVSLQLKWLLGIVSLFEHSKKGKEVISIPFLLEFIPEGDVKEKIKEEIEKQKPILNNLWEWRCKILAHQDVVVAENIGDFYKEYPIKAGEPEKILESAQKLLGMIKSTTVEHGESYSFRIFEEESQSDAESIIKALDYFFQERKKHYEKIKKREIDDISFPPSSKKDNND